ncbi:MAG: cytochrome c [Bryobacterales bacterium]|nr:cytochrome c [Bryobacterales bacterium]
MKLLAVLLVVAGTGIPATRRLLPGDPDHGRELFRSQNCVACHSFSGPGASVGPDLARLVARGFTPAQLASAMWNHAPRMWAAMKRHGVARPELSEQQAADLFAFFFAAHSFEKPGQPRQGEEVFQSKRCAECHGLDTALGSGITPVSGWAPLPDSVALTREMWNHPRSGFVFPRIASRQLTDLLSYLQSFQGQPTGPRAFSPGSAESGTTLLETKGCTGCHVDPKALESRSTRYGATDLAAVLWNHVPKLTGSTPPVSYQEMRDLIAYLSSAQFLEERGDMERGKTVFARKRCATCHENLSSGAPNLAAVSGKMTSFDMMAAVWKHGPGMWSRMQERRFAWPHFRDSEMADLTAYLHGVEFRQRSDLVRQRVRLAVDPRQ